MGCLLLLLLMMRGMGVVGTGELCFESFGWLVGWLVESYVGKEGDVM